MGLTNLNNVHLAAATLAAANTSLKQLETTLAGINVTLTADDRQRYGSINEQNKLFVNKVYDFNQNQSGLSTPQVNWTEFNNDHNSRLNMENLINRLESLITKLKNAKILHDYDNLQAALADYGYTNYMAGTGAAGYETKQNELKQFFSKTAAKNTPPQE